MNDAPTLPVLEQLVQRESHSLLQYMSDAFPWTTAKDRDAWTELQRLIAEERQGVGALVQFLVRRRHMFPYLGGYPANFTNINFVALEHLLPLLVDHERRAIAELERDLAQLSDPEAYSQVQTYLEMKRRHLLSLGALSTAHLEPAVH